MLFYKNGLLIGEPFRFSTNVSNSNSSSNSTPQSTFYFPAFSVDSFQQILVNIGQIPYKFLPTENHTHSNLNGANRSVTHVTTATPSAAVDTTDATLVTVQNTTAEPVSITESTPTAVLALALTTSDRDRSNSSYATTSISITAATAATSAARAEGPHSSISFGDDDIRTTITADIDTSPSLV